MTHRRWPSRRWGYGPAAWAGAFAALHLYWALGGSVGLPESAGVTLATERPAWFVLGALYGVAGALLVAAVLGVALARGTITGRRRLLPLLGTGVAALPVLRAVGIEILLLTDTGYGDGAVDADQRRWTLALWNPWFLAGGAAFGTAALAAHRAARSTPAAAAARTTGRAPRT